MSLPFWDPNHPSYQQVVADIGATSLWDSAYLSGVQIPGIVSIDGEPGRKIDVKSAPGSDGATVTDQGFEPAKGTISITVWTQAQWSALQTLLAQYVPKPGKSSQKPTVALSLSHPGMNSVGVTDIIITSVSAPKVSSTQGARQVDIKYVQWVKSRSADLSTIIFSIPHEGAVEGDPPATPELGTPSSNNTNPYP